MRAQACVGVYACICVVKPCLLIYLSACICVVKPCLLIYLIESV